MKKPVLLALVALLGSTTLFAQKFEVGINGGEIFNTKPTVKARQEGVGLFGAEYRYSKSLLLSTTGILFLNYNINKRWQTGISVGIEELSHREYGTSTLTPMEYEIEAKMRIAYDAIPIALHLNRKLSLKKMVFYGGISAGYTLFHSPQGLKGDNLICPTENGSGYLAGVQVGWSYYFSKHFGTNVQAAYQYLWLHINSYDCQVSALPFTAGIRYRF